MSRKPTNSEPSTVETEKKPRKSRKVNPLRAKLAAEIYLFDNGFRFITVVIDGKFNSAYSLSADNGCTRLQTHQETIVSRMFNPSLKAQESGIIHLATLATSLVNSALLSALALSYAFSVENTNTGIGLMNEYLDSVAQTDSK